MTKLFEPSRDKIIFGLLSILGLCILSIDHSNFVYSSENNDSEIMEEIPDFTFVAAGDFRCMQEANKTVTNMVKIEPDLVLALGDLSYQRDGNCWFDLFSPLDKLGKIKITLGDHDIDPDLSRYKQYLAHFNLSKPYYSFDYQNIHFLAMETGKQRIIPYDNMSEQYRFIDQDLKNAHNNESIDWIIVFGFRPFYSSNSTHPGSELLRETYHPLFDEYGVNIVLQAHNHNYQRTYPLEYNRGNDFDPIVSDKHKRKYNGDLNSPIFVTVGTGGRDLHNLTGKEYYIITQFIRFGFLRVDITNNGAHLMASFYDNTEQKGNDHFSIIKTRQSQP